MTLRPTDIDAVDMIILPPVRDLGDGFQVRRALPSAHRRMVGPFVFFDQFGPTTFSAGEGHSERSANETRKAGGPLFGLQTWVALPKAKEEADPAFFHHAADTIPETEADGVHIRVVAGSSDGLTSPVQAFSDMLYADVTLQDGARYQLSAEHIERAVYVISGALAVEGQSGQFDAGELVIFKPDAEIVLQAKGPTRIMLVGGEPLDGPRHIYWNFVSSSRERIEQAKEDWRQGRFESVPGESEFIPLPD